MWPSTGLCFTENHPSVSIIHIQSQTVFVAVFFLCFYGKPPLCLFWFSPGSTLSFNQTHPITNCTCHCVFFCDFTARRLSACLGFPQDRPSGLLPLLKDWIKERDHLNLLFLWVSELNQPVIFVFGSAQPLGKLRGEARVWRLMANAILNFHFFGILP